MLVRQRTPNQEFVQLRNEMRLVSFQKVDDNLRGQRTVHRGQDSDTSEQDQQFYKQLVI